MKREEKNLQSRQKILNAALKEFGDKSYAEASLNTVCREGDISKGIIYHYFRDKDELFLACVKECFDALTAYLKEHLSPDEGEAEQMLGQYFDRRTDFFDRNPVYLKLFYSTVILPPAHLAEAISNIRQDFDTFNVTVLTELLQRVSLRGDITMEEVVEEFKLYQDVINTQYQMQNIHRVNLKEYEERCGRTLRILLYGVVAREKVQP